MIVYQTGTITTRAKDSVDTMSYAATMTGITNELLAKGLNHIFVEDTGFYRILFVLQGTAYLAEAHMYSNGTLVKDLATDTIKKVKVESGITIVAK
jgi:hypothetical protein